MREAVLLRRLIKLVDDYKKSKTRKAVVRGKLGGLTRARNLSPERRREISRHANAVRWHKDGAK